MSKNDTSKKVVSALDMAINSDVWSKSVVLKVIHKRLVAIRDRFSSSSPDRQETLGSVQDNRMFHKEVKVYISLYLSGGRDLSRWERLFRSISNGIQGRPTYSEEVYARNYVNSKNGSASHGYIIVSIDPKYILNVKDSKCSKDALGQKVISIMSRSVSPDRIIEFVHKNKDRYRLVNEALILTK